MSIISGASTVGQINKTYSTPFRSSKVHVDAHAYVCIKNIASAAKVLGYISKLHVYRLCMTLD